MQADAAGQPQSDVPAVRPGDGVTATARQQYPAQSPGLGPNNGQRSDVVPLFGGGVFDDSYNADRAPLRVLLPDDVRQVLLVSVITGARSIVLMVQCC